MDPVLSEGIPVVLVAASLPWIPELEASSQTKVEYSKHALKSKAESLFVAEPANFADDLNTFRVDALLCAFADSTRRGEIPCNESEERRYLAKAAEQTTF